VLNSLVYRLKTGVRYRDISKSEDYAAKSTVYHWLSKWSEASVLEHIWRQFLAELEANGKIDLSQGSLDGSFVPTKRGARR
jgi:transposase